jgi:copper chaperone CopZ
MDCLMCAAGLQNKLSKLPGVSKAEVSYQDKRALIEFDPAVIARARLVQAIEGDGFKVVAQGSPSGPSSPPPSRGR